MSDEMIPIKNEDGAFSAYNDTYDIVIHCESEEEQKKVIEHLKTISWIPVAERLPEEHDSIFAKLKGTDEWKPGMFEKISKNVLATIKYDDGTLLSKQAHTIDGKWKTELSCLGGTVIAWKPYPEPYKEK